MIRIAFIEDDSFYLESLKEALHLQPELVFALGAPSIQEFWEMLPKRASLDIIFVDIDLPGQSGVQALPDLRKRFPTAELVMLTQNEGKDVLLQSFSNGATGYLIKDFPVLELPSHIFTLLKGGALISPQMARWIIDFFNPPKAVSTGLTGTELQLLRLFSQGKSYGESSQVLGISVDGVKYRVKRIYSKLNVNNKVDALRLVKDKL